MTTQITFEPALQDVLTHITYDLSDTRNQYIISANYYEHQTENRFGER